MTDPRPAGSASTSPRVALAVTAETVATAMPGVALTDAGDAYWQTGDRDHRVRGVTALAQGDGRYELRMRIAVSWPPEPLRELAEDLRRRVTAAAKREGLRAALGDVHVEICSIIDPADSSAEPS